MPERVKQILDRGRDFFKNMNKRLRIGLIAGGAAIVVLIAALAIYNATRPYEILYSGLSSEDLTAIVTYLDSVNVKDFQIRNNDTVLVRESQASALRTQIIMQGYASSGYAYGTYLDHISALSSQADRQQLVLYDLQDRLGRDIRTFDGVKGASVYLTPGEDRRYILSDNVLEAKAAVKVQMQTGKTLTSDQVAAIQRLVGNAMQGVEISSVTVEDNLGSSYTSGGDSTAGALSDTMKHKLALESQLNEETRNRVMKVLVPYFGSDNVEVSVHSTVDVSRTYTESLVYHEPDWAADGSTGGKGIIGSQIWDNSLIRDGDTTAGGTVGTTTNTEINEYVTREGQVRGDEREIYNSGQIDYDVSQDKIQRELPPGTVTDLTVAIAVNSTESNMQDPTKFVRLAATAAGISAEDAAEKVTIVSAPFYQERGDGTGVIISDSTIFGMPSWAVYAAIAGIALFLALLLILMLLRNGKKKKYAAAAEEAAALAALAAENAALPTEGADIMDVHAEESMQMRKDIRKFVEENPAIAAQMIKNWLRGGEEA